MHAVLFYGHRVLKKLIKFDDAPFDIPLLLARLRILGILGKIAVFLRLLQALRDLVALFALQELKLFLEFLEPLLGARFFPHIFMWQ